MYYNGYIRLYTVTVATLFLLSPLLALPYILLGIYRQERSAYFFFALFLGFLAWLQVPLSDLFRHSLNIYHYLDKPFSYAYVNKQSADYFIPIVNWILVNGNIPYQYLRLFSVTESFFLLTVIFNYMIETSEREYTYGEVFMRFCIMYLFFEFIMTTSGVRYGFAVCQYIYALHLVFNKKSWLPALFFALFATQIHVSFAFFIPISVLLYWLCSTKRKTIVFFGLLSVVLIPIISHFSYLLGRRADWYFGGGNSVSDNSAITIYGFILTIGVRLFLLPFLVLVYQYFTPPYTHAHQSRNTKHSCRWTRMAAVWIGMAVMFITNMTMLYRLTFVLSTIGIFLLLEIEQHFYIRKRFITILLWCGIMTTLCNTVNYRSIILNSRYQYIAMPVPVILQDHYDKQWILEHVNGNKMKQ